jgi:LemA protein
MHGGSTVALAVVGFIVLIVVIWAIGTYNSFVRLRNLVQESWRQIDVELKRRHDLIPNLVETVKAYATHEQAVFESVTRARSAASEAGLSPAAQAQAEDVLSQGLGRLLAISEAYPQLQANQGFLGLHKELTNTEDRIAAGRRFYNANVRSLNTKIETFPASIIAGMSHVIRAEYFEVTTQAEREVPQVNFGAPPVGSGGQAAPPAPPA